MEYAVEIKNLSKSYKDTSGKEVKVLEGVTMCLESGKVHGIMGASGTGKTTLLSVIGLLDTYDSGSLIVGGQEIGRLKEQEMAEIRKKKVGFVFQNYYLNPHLTVEDNLILPLKINKEIKKSQYHDRVISLLGQFGMEQYAKRYPLELSGGEQQRVCIARALANDPDIILADEPTGSLDAENEKMVLDYLKSLTEQGKTVVIVSHNEIVRDYADKLIGLKKGGSYDAL